MVEVFSVKSIYGLRSIRTVDGEVSGPFLSGSVHQPTRQEKAALPAFCPALIISFLSTTTLFHPNPGYLEHSVSMESWVCLTNHNIGK